MPSQVSFLAICKAVDKDFDRDNRRPVIYEFAGNRVRREDTRGPYSRPTVWDGGESVWDGGASVWDA